LSCSQARDALGETRATAAGCPLEPLQLQDMQEVTLTITDTSAIDEDLGGCFTAEEWLEAETDTVTWDEVRQALAGISGSLSDAVTAQRQER